MVAVEIVCLCEISRPHTEVAQLMDGCRPFRESLELVGRSILLGWLFPR
jgi:hypothetical protein